MVIKRINSNANDVKLSQKYRQDWIKKKKKETVTVYSIFTVLNYATSPKFLHTTGLTTFSFISSIHVCNRIMTLNTGSELFKKERQSETCGLATTVT